MIDQGLSASTVNVRLSAIRKLISEARDNNLPDPVEAARILTVPGVPTRGVRLGKTVVTAAKSAGIDHLGPHDLRRYAECGISAGLLPNFAARLEATSSRCGVFLVTRIFLRQRFIWARRPCPRKTNTKTTPTTRRC